MTWSDKQFRQRIERRCQQLGRSQRDVLKAAGLTHDYLGTVPKYGRRVDIIEKLAAALDWTLAEALGLPTRSAIDPVLLRRAYHSSRRIMLRLNSNDVDTQIAMQAVLYDLFIGAPEHYADANSAVDEYAAFIEQSLYMQFMNPRYLSSVLRKMQRIQGSRLPTVRVPEAAPTASTQLSDDVADHPTPDK